MDTFWEALGAALETLETLPAPAIYTLSAGCVTAVALAAFRRGSAPTTTEPPTEDVHIEEPPAPATPTAATGSRNVPKRKISKRMQELKGKVGTSRADRYSVCGCGWVGRYVCICVSVCLCVCVCVYVCVCVCVCVLKDVCMRTWMCAVSMCTYHMYKFICLCML